MQTRWRYRSVALSIALLIAQRTASLGAQQSNDAEYTAKIRELTPTDSRWKFTTELVDHLPASATVPTPLKVLGYVPGTIGRLSRTEDLNRYFRAVAAASPRVKVFSLGMSEEGREMIIAAVADENTIKRLDDYRNMAVRLADPRGESDAERTRLIHEAKPIYWLTGTIHAPETGSPEMLMELLYRLAVEESPYIQRIRNNVITLITPATEVDGRNRIIDIIEEEKQLKLGRGGIPTVYWGKYIAHDNNRDGLMMSIKLTQNVNAGFMQWRPTIMHDLHESVPFLYTSTGTGPYNDEFDPITVGEWHTLAYQEVNELTKRGLPGVWTHGFYDGWAPNYMLGVAQFRNSMGKFYETYTSGGADCQIVNLPAASISKEWYRPNPPVNGIKWCIRSNINYQQSGVLVALKYVADNRDTFMEDFALKATRMVDRGKTSAPYAFVIPRDQRHAAEAADLVNYFRKAGTEVQVATSSFSTRSMPPVVERGLIANAGGAGGGAAAPGAGGRGGRGGRGGDSTTRADSGSSSRTVNVNAGDWIVRMDQPYTALVRTVLAVQRFRPDDPSPYDDTGWSLNELRHVTVHTIADSSVLNKPMQLLKEDARVNGTVAGNGGTLIVTHSGDWRSAVLPWKVGGAKLTVSDSAFTANGQTYPAGTYIAGSTPAIRDAIAQLGLRAAAASSAPSVRAHAVQLPRIVFVHTWIETQNEGWVRHALEDMGVPFTYTSTQRLKEPGFLERFDVVLFPHVSGPATSMVNGKPMVGPAIPWKTTALTPNLGKIDSTDDIRPELGLDGLAALRRFVERGGLLLVEGNTSRLPVDFGFTPAVSIATTPRLLARGAIFRAEAVTRSTPILYGYDGGVIPVYFNTAPLFNVASGRGGEGGGGPGGDDERSLSVAQNRPDPSIARQTAAQRPRVILRFVPNADSLLVSGLLDNGSEMSGRAAVVDAPLGQGHVVMFGIRPMWRYETQGSYAMVLNALANWNALDTNERAQRIATDGARDQQ